MCSVGIPNRTKRRHRHGRRSLGRPIPPPSSRRRLWRRRLHGPETDAGKSIHHEQCDQLMARLLFNIFSIFNNENLPNSI